jgi:ABC-type sugar transport system substrate-binding protein
MANLNWGERMKNKRFNVILACIASTSLGIGVGTLPAGAAPPVAHPSVIFLNELSTDTFWQAANVGAAGAAKALGDPYSSLDAGGNATTQVAQLEAALARKVNVLLIAPVDSKVLGPYVKKAEAQGVKVCAVGIGMSNEYVDATVVLEEKTGAADDAKQILQWAKAQHRKSITVLEGEIDPTQQAGQLRTAGFNSVMKNPNPYGVNVNLVQRVFGSSLGTVVSVMGDTLTATTHIDAAYMQTDFYAPAVVTALKAHHYTTYKGKNHVYLVGTTATTSGLAAIRGGWEDYSQNDPVPQEGATCVRLGVAMYKGQSAINAAPGIARAEGLNPAKTEISNNPVTGPYIQELYQPITRANVNSSAFWPNVIK